MAIVERIISTREGGKKRKEFVSIYNAFLAVC